MACGLLYIKPQEMRLQAIAGETFVLFGVRNHDKATSPFVPHLRRYFVVTSPRNGVRRFRSGKRVGDAGGTLAAIIISYSALRVRAAQTIEDFVFFRLVTGGGDPDFSLSINTPLLF